jgi:hypothetical protein
VIAIAERASDSAIERGEASEARDVQPSLMA